jgi:hypothetical protein
MEGVLHLLLGDASGGVAFLAQILLFRAIAEDARAACLERPRLALNLVLASLALRLRRATRLRRVALLCSVLIGHRRSPPAGW